MVALTQCQVNAVMSAFCDADDEVSVLFWTSTSNHNRGGDIMGTKNTLPTVEHNSAISGYFQPL
jgi:hypothetical protein